MAGVSLLWNNKMTAASGAALVMMGNGWKYGVSCGWIGTWDGCGLFFYIPKPTLEVLCCLLVRENKFSRRIA